MNWLKQHIIVLSNYLGEDLGKNILYYLKNWYLNPVQNHTKV